MRSFSRIPLPIRIAHPPYSELECFSDEYFEFLKKCGYQGFYLQDSPIDSMRTGNAGNFKRHFHLISLYDISFGYRSQDYVGYVREICHRAGRHELEVHLCLWEPRIPEYARGVLPLEWQGSGGFSHHGFHRIGLCWGVPDAVAYWKNMARTALDLLPEIRGLHLGMVDNEANFCDETCPKCHGASRDSGILEVYGCLGEIARSRKAFRIAIYDWWFPPDVLSDLPDLLPENTLLIGRSAQGFSQEIDGMKLPGVVEDITCIMDSVSDATLKQVQRSNALGFDFVDMVAWSHPNETWWLPAAPDPVFAIRKLKALRAAGASGFYDFDCGAIMPGSVSDAVCSWTGSPDDTEEELLCKVLGGIWKKNTGAVMRAYELFREAKLLFPIALHVSEPCGFSGRSVGLSVLVVAPFHLADLRFQDTGHRFNWFAPFSLLTGDTLPILEPLLRRMVPLQQEAWSIASSLLDTSNEAAVRECESFEIHFRHTLSMLHYVELAGLKWTWVQGGLSDDLFLEGVRGVGIRESENTLHIGNWIERNPRGIGNPCHQLHGWLVEMWPDLNFSDDLLGPKRASLGHLASLQTTVPIPDYVIHNC